VTRAWQGMCVALSGKSPEPGDPRFESPRTEAGAGAISRGLGKWRQASLPGQHEVALPTSTQGWLQMLRQGRG
jgi:hypothetical protein